MHLLLSGIPHLSSNLRQSNHEGRTAGRKGRRGTFIDQRCAQRGATHLKGGLITLLSLGRVHLYQGYKTLELY